MCASCGVPAIKKNDKPEDRRQWLPYWKEVEGFKNWIVLDRSDMFRVYCRICDKSLGCTTTTLKDHTTSKKHRQNCAIHNVPVIEIFTIPTESEWHKQMVVDEINWAAMHPLFNLSFVNSNKMAEYLSKIDKDSVFAFLRVGATKVTNIVKKVVAAGAK